MCPARENRGEGEPKREKSGGVCLGGSAKVGEFVKGILYLER